MYRILMYQYSDVEYAIFGEDTKHFKHLLEAHYARWSKTISNVYSNKRYKAQRLGGWLINIANLADLESDFKLNRILIVKK